MGEHIQRLGHPPARRLDAEPCLVAGGLTESGVLSEQSLARMLELVGRFGRFLISRLSAAWALAEATARTAELPNLVIADLDLDHARVWLHGSPRTDPRWGTVDEWGVRQLARHVRNLGKDPNPHTRLVYAGSSSAESRQASSCLAIGETLRRAGLGGEPDVRPLSVVAWAGARVFADTGRIDEAARALGVRSLDRAARTIGFDWHDTHGPA